MRSGVYRGGRRIGRAARKPRRRMSRKMRVSRVPRAPSNNTHSYVTWITTSTLVGQQSAGSFAGNLFQWTAPGSTSEVDLTFGFGAAEIPNWSQLDVLYDQYRLNGVLMTAKLVNVPENSLIPNGVTNTYNPLNYYPTIWIVNDFDDITVTGLASLKQYTRVKQRVLRPNSVVKHFVKPKVQGPLVATGNITSNVGTDVRFKTPWLNCSYDIVPHYGIKCAIDFQTLNPPSGTKFYIQFEFKYYFQMKNVR